METVKEFQISRATGALLGLAAGDALGTTLEFKPKDSYTALTDMVGGGPFNLEPGQWTDDTSMMLCLADSLIEKGGMDLNDQMQRYVRWYRHGENSCNGTCFDIGMTVQTALFSYESTGNPQSGSTSHFSAGNGSLMRVAPIALFFAHDNEQQAMQAAKLSSLTTHGEERCVQACEIMTLLIHRLLNSEHIADREVFLKTTLSDYLQLSKDCHPEVRAIAECQFFSKSRESIHGTGYVVASLEAALWCFVNSDSFEDGALLAANLGDDADTTAAIFGQLAGAYYGASAIPSKWQLKLAWESQISDTAMWLLQRPTNQQVKDFVSELSVHIERQDPADIALYSMAYEHDLMVTHIDYNAPFYVNDIDAFTDFEAWLHQASFRDCICWMIRLVRTERFWDGVIESNIRNGSVTRWLNNMHRLLSLHGE
ncbi:ADP-ribosylglycohydrolase family protein [Photobacterium aphoticum]|uniref:ADP-ribosylglycohydrolase family protein n=1 Tax=Photobacterium aphoticum TaxID=754436 RepID=A0A090QPS1_9GAMM|nr:ADP-ribosylglycohydrolase family protein [Photobacterium aphoticum]